MRVLITNDDGIQSPGLVVLAQVALEAGCDVVVAAPHRQYSGASASLTAKEVDGRLALVDARPPGLPDGVLAFGVKAAPALITFVAAYGAFGERPDLVLSGVNLGANTGRATLHSGTVGAALSSATQGIPALAMSIASAEPQHWETARLVTTHAFAWLREQGADEERVLNVNVPDIPVEQLRGLRPARLASFGAVQARVREKGQDYVTLTYSGVDAEDEPGSDHHLLARGWATATLLTAPYDEPGDTELPSFTGRGDAPVSVDVGSGTVMSAGDDRPSGEIAEEHVEDPAAH
ncbi:5'-nucleotidase [Georgenia satyanarayanai]|uniref:5'-nucleotidase SurE n=1 Tax=Georgenia satyanarayanai TaxID=860221 RepID=A0A2Y9BZW5_9MICO|nr:5'/3'-nucleotidase SurE [Georgenia satyanarayanai]PYF98432.1 5'-nucleotidase [Georgenia satyanarayanai]SSA45092.1 5'-nucleotidase [Georgenia satyanarayanai]